jgi:FAD/FMN-containing dehydrogenase
MSGSLVLPGSSGYPSDVQSYNPVFDGTRPQAIAYVGSPGDVAKAVAFGRDHGVQLSVRSGGHCYGGWSTGRGFVLDVTRLSHVSVSGDQVAVGSGARLVDLYGACAPHGLAVPGGSCPTVGIAGLTLGGGLGVIDRKFGLTCDNLQSADVVLASGALVTCDASTHPDLFWALKGGGGGNFGVVTGFRFLGHPIGDLAIFTLVWSWSSAAQAVAAWQAWAPHAPDEVWSNCLLIASQDTPSGEAPVARVTGVYVGSQSALEAELQPLLSAIPAGPFTNFIGSASYLDTMLIEAGCDGKTVEECHLPTENPAGTLTRAPFAAKSDIVTKPLPTTGIKAMMAAVEARQASPVLSGGGMALDAAGGAINRVGATATAFVHRDGLFTIQYSASWNEGAPTSVVAANRTWLQQAWGSMRPYVSGQAYQNYIDPALQGWAKAYYGENLQRLEEVKARYDPDDVWRFPQSIPVAR